MQDSSFPKKLVVMDDAKVEMLRNQTPAERLAIVSDANDTVPILVTAGVRWQYPEWNETRVQIEIVR